MWDIMTKVGDKVGSVLSKNERFRRKLNQVVWVEHLDPIEFEQGWNSVMEEFCLGDHSWFKQLVELCK